MLRLIGRRIALSGLLLVLVTFTIFVMVDLMPGDPAAILAGPGADAQNVAYVRHTLHLNDSLVHRYTIWISHAVTGDLGTSYVVPHFSVTSELGRSLPVTASLIGLALASALVYALVLGTIAALRRGTFIDRALTFLFALSMATPGFWLAYVLVIWFAIDLHWLPAIGYQYLSAGFWPWLSHLILPASVLGLSVAPALALQLRSALIEVLREDFITSARAKGLRGRSVILKHALKNAAVPVATLLGYQITNLIGQTVVIENVFAITGVGSLALSATVARDVPTLLGIVVITTLAVVIVNLLVDISYGFFNPKVTTG